MNERIGARCKNCGHYETNYARAERDLAHCPSCGRPSAWLVVHEECGALIGPEGESCGVPAEECREHGGTCERSEES